MEYRGDYSTPVISSPIRFFRAPTFSPSSGELPLSKALRSMKSPMLIFFPLTGFCPPAEDARKMNIESI